MVKVLVALFQSIADIVAIIVFGALNLIGMAIHLWFYIMIIFLLLRCTGI